MRYLRIIFILVVGCFAGKSLDISEFEQRKDQWCWAGCSKMILDYHNIEVSQGEIVQFGLGDSSLNRPNYLWGSGQFTYNGTTQYQQGISKILENWGFGGYNDEWYASEYTLTEDQWKKEIDDGHPFVVNWNWHSGGGHFVVGMGYLDNGNYELTNPWFGTGYTVASYDWIKNRPDHSGNPTNGGGDGSWEYTLVTHKAPPTVTEYQLIVENGEGSGIFVPGAEVTIIANESPADSVFDSWNGTENLMGTFDSIAVFTMPAEDLLLSALYKEKIPVSILSINIQESNRNVVLSNKAIELQDFNNGEHLVSLFTVNGRLIFEKRINVPHEKSIQLPQLQQGVIIVQIQSDGQLFTAKLIQ